VSFVLGALYVFAIWHQNQLSGSFSIVCSFGMDAEELVIDYLSIFCSAFDSSYYWDAVVRGENLRRKFNHIKKKCTARAPIAMDEQLVAAVYLQSGKCCYLLLIFTFCLLDTIFSLLVPAVIRGWLARKHFNNMHKMKWLIHENSNSKRKPGKKISEVKVRSLV
jgi:hypothetical protein